MKRRDVLKVFGASVALAGAGSVHTARAQATGRAGKVRYVSRDGSDRNDGHTLGSAKRTVAAAVRSLPDEEEGAKATKAGDIYIGAGLFVEHDTPIECSSNIRFHGVGVGLGVGSSDGETTGTVIKLGDNRRTHLFAPRPTFEDWAHGVTFERMTLHGNNKNNAGDFDLIRLKRPGFNTALRDVFLHDAPRTGIHVEEAASNFYMFNITGAGCKKHFFKYESLEGTNNVSIAMFGIQIDCCGRHPIQIDNRADGWGHFAIYGLEAEAPIPREHQSIVRYNPIGGANGLSLTIDNIMAWKARDAVQPDEAIVLIEDGSGSGPLTTYRNLVGDGYEWVYRDRKAGINSKQSELAKFGRSPWTSMQLGPVTWATATDGPEDQVTAPPGSLCSKTDGTLWVKASGMDSKGWKEVRLR